MYFDDATLKRLGLDDKRVIATALKERYRDAGALTCVCEFTAGDGAISPLGPVLAGVDCTCSTPEVFDNSGVDAANSTTSEVVAPETSVSGVEIVPETVPTVAAE